MGVLSNILLVLFIISALFIILLVVIQDDQGDSIGGLFAGSSTSPFRSRSGNILQHITTGFAIFFLVSALGYAVMIKPADPLAHLNIDANSGTFLEELLAEPQEPEVSPQENQGGFINPLNQAGATGGNLSGLGLPATTEGS